MDFCGLFFLMALAMSVKPVQGGGTVTTTLLSYTQHQPRNFNGELCDTQSHLPCDRFYMIEISPGGQPTLKVETPVILGNDFSQLPSFLVHMDQLTTIRYEITLFDRDDGNPAPIRTQSSLLGTVTVNGFSLDSTLEAQNITVNTSENFHSITFRVEVKCDKNFFGPSCDKKCTEDIDSHYTCDQNGDIFCKPGFTDILSGCSISLDLCSSNPCQNGASCSMGEDQAVQCACPVGFAGEFCDIDIDECECNPCSNGGTCVQASLPGDFSCICKPGWQGELCEADVDECAAGACPEEVSCVNTPGSFVCCIGVIFDPNAPPEVPVTRPPIILEPLPQAPDTMSASSTAAPLVPSSTVSSATRIPTPVVRTPAAVTPAPSTTPTTTAPTTTASTPAPTEAAATPAPTAQSTPSTQSPTVQAPTPAQLTTDPTPTQPAPAVTIPTTAAPNAVPSQAPNPSPVVQPTPGAPQVVNLTPSPVTLVSDPVCGNPTPELKSRLIQNLRQLVQRKFFQLLTVNLQDVTAAPIVFGNYVRSKCGVSIIGGVLANPIGSTQTACLLKEVNNCLFLNFFKTPVPSPVQSPPPVQAPAPVYAPAPANPPVAPVPSKGGRFYNPTQGSRTTGQGRFVPAHQ